MTATTAIEPRLLGTAFEKGNRAACSAPQAATGRWAEIWGAGTPAAVGMEEPASLQRNTAAETKSVEEPEGETGILRPSGTSSFAARLPASTASTAPRNVSYLPALTAGSATGGERHSGSTTANRHTGGGAGETATEIRVYDASAVREVAAPRITRLRATEPQSRKPRAQASQGIVNAPLHTSTRWSAAVVLEDVPAMQMTTIPHQTMPAHALENADRTRETGESAAGMQRQVPGTEVQNKQIAQTVQPAKGHVRGKTKVAISHGRFLVETASGARRAAADLRPVADAGSYIQHPGEKTQRAHQPAQSKDASTATRAGLVRQDVIQTKTDQTLPAEPAPLPALAPATTSTSISPQWQGVQEQQVLGERNEPGAGDGTSARAVSLTEEAAVNLAVAQQPAENTPNDASAFAGMEREPSSPTASETREQATVAVAGDEIAARGGLVEAKGETLLGATKALKSGPHTEAQQGQSTRWEHDPASAFVSTPRLTGMRAGILTRSESPEPAGGTLEPKMEKGGSRPFATAGTETTAESPTVSQAPGDQPARSDQTRNATTERIPSHGAERLAHTDDQGHAQEGAAQGIESHLAVPEVPKAVEESQSGRRAATENGKTGRGPLDSTEKAPALAAGSVAESHTAHETRSSTRTPQAPAALDISQGMRWAENANLTREMGGAHTVPSTAEGPGGSVHADSPGSRSKEAFTTMDGSSPAPGATWTHAGGRRAEAGYQDPELGWVGVRAEVSQGGIHASLIPGTAHAAQALDGQLAGLSAHLAARHMPVETLTMSTPERWAGGSERSQDEGQAMQQGAGQGADQDSGQGAAPRQRAEDRALDGTTVSGLVAPERFAQDQRESIAYLATEGSTISVMA